MDHPYDGYEQRGPQASGAFSDRRGRESELAHSDRGEGQETLPGAGSISGARPAQGAAQPSDPTARDHRFGLCPRASEAKCWQDEKKGLVDALHSLYCAVRDCHPGKLSLPLQRTYEHAGYVRKCVLKGSPQEQISSTIPGGPLQEEFEDELSSEFDPDDEGVPY